MYENRFAVSKTRIENFNTCPRKYYYRHYGHWDGWLTTASEEKQQIYRLSKLSSRPMWVGSVVHNTIDEIIREVRSGNSRSREYWLTKISRQMSQQWRASEQAMENGSFYSRPKQVAEQTACLVEHYYHIDETTQPDHLTADICLAQHCIRQYFSTDIHKQLLQTRRNKIIPIEPFATTCVDGIDVMVQIDLLLSDEHGLYTIVDWKTGQHQRIRSALDQVIIYGLYVHQELGITQDNSRVCVVDLYHGREYLYPLEQRWLNAARRSVLHNARVLQSYLADVERNQAKIEQFPKTQRHQDCLRCPFWELCYSN